MISPSHLSARSMLLLVASVLLWAAVAPHHSLVSASPLKSQSSLSSSLSLSGSPVESKAAGETASPADYLGGEEDVPTPLEALTKLLSSQPQLRLLTRPGSVESEAAPAPATTILLSRKEDTESGDNARMVKLLQSYFLSNSRLPRRFGPTSKRAAAMGVDLPDYILHINKGRNFDFSSFREKMQKSG